MWDTLIFFSALFFWQPIPESANGVKPLTNDQERLIHDLVCYQEQYEDPPPEDLRRVFGVNIFTCFNFFCSFLNPFLTLAVGKHQTLRVRGSMRRGKHFFHWNSFLIHWENVCEFVSEYCHFLSSSKYQCSWSEKKLSIFELFRWHKLLVA